MGSSSRRTPATCQSSARKAVRVRGLPDAQQSDLGEAAFLYKAISLNFVVAKPHGYSYCYDFIVDGESGLWRVQVKACATIVNRLYRVRICHRKDGVPTAYTASEIDFAAAYIIPEQTWYVVPVREVVGHTSLCFRPREFPRLHTYAHCARRGTCCLSR